ncbi:MAG: hypothetical protein IJ313_04330 [Clostridia bacterium]|nr:hypothetical protein [Clostridia bacterium]
MRFFDKWFGRGKQQMQAQKPEQKPVPQPEQREEKSEQPAQTSPSAVTARDAEHWKKIIRVAMDCVAKQMREQAAANERLAKASVSMDLPGTENLGLFVVELNSRNLKHKMLSARVVRKGSDYCMMHFIKSAASEEILAYLEDGANADELYASLSELSDKIDDRF